jgi:hypothetical protein
MVKQHKHESHDRILFFFLSARLLEGRSFGESNS